MTHVLTRPTIDPRGLYRLAKFCLVGFFGLGVNTGVLFLLHTVIGVPVLLAASIAYEVAVMSTYLCHDFWTFRRRSPSLSRFLKFNAVALGALALTVVTLHLLTDVAGIYYLVANLVGTGLGTLWNFSINVLWTWRSRSSQVDTPVPFDRAAHPSTGPG